MFRTITSVISVAATVSIAASAMAAPPLPPSGIRPGPSITTPKIIPSVVCNVDPAVASITLTKGGRRGQVQVTYEIVNRGRSAWRSGANQQGVHLRAVNGNTGGVFADDRVLTGSAAAGASMLRVTTRMIENAFDDFEFGGHVELAITYDPDIFIDGNKCNDDANMANNTFRVENGDILAFMKGTARTRTFRR